MFYIKIYFCIYGISFLFNIGYAFYIRKTRPDTIIDNIEIDKENRQRFGDGSINILNNLVVWIFPYLLTLVIFVNIVKTKLNYKI